jgi:hypothetical protein
MTPLWLAREIQKLKVHAPVTSAFERDLIVRNDWGRDGVWYANQKEHWLGWLSEYDGPGYYGRKKPTRRSAEFAYNHVVCPPMVLWLGEAAGVTRKKVLGAKQAALSGPRRLPSMSAAIRKIIPFAEIESLLRDPP